MNVRDALEADADALASIADSPTDVMRNLVHDRTVRVAEDGARGSDEANDEGDDESGPDVSRGSQYGVSDPDDVLGFVSFDAKEETVHVTQIDGTADACERLLAEPVRFAECESMAVEVLVTPDQRSVRDAVDELGFDERGPGPRFGDDGTIRYRLEP